MAARPVTFQPRHLALASERESLWLPSLGDWADRVLLASPQAASCCTTRFNDSGERILGGAPEGSRQRGGRGRGGGSKDGSGDKGKGGGKGGKGGKGGRGGK